MKRKESYLFIIRAITKFNKASTISIKLNKVKNISSFKISTILFNFFILYCKYNIIKKPKDKSVYPNIVL